MRQRLDTNDLGRFSLNQCRKITVKELQNEAMKHIPAILKEMYPEGSIQTTKCNFGGNRYWFECMKCNSRCFTLYEIPIIHQYVCRKCTGLAYNKQRFKGMLELDTETNTIK